MARRNSISADEDSEEDFDWEEVAVPVEQAELPVPIEDDDVQEGPSILTAGRANIEITLQAKAKVDDSAKKRAAALHAERVTRVSCHKVHTILLLGNASIRNRWINDELLKARLLSLTPMNLQNAFAAIHKSRIPEAAKRGRMFESAITRLVEWWFKSFTVLPTGHIRSRTFEDVQKELAAKVAKAVDRKGKGRARDSEDSDDDDDEAGEVIRSEKSLMKHALMHRGSRDVSAQLFTSLCRALGIPARLVVSLQSVPWQASVGKPKTAAKKKPKANAKGKQKADADDEQDDEMEEVDIPRQDGGGVFPGAGRTLNGNAVPAEDARGKGKQKASPVITLRKSKGRKLGSVPTPKPKRELISDPTETAPVFWTEVFSRADARWLPIDPVRYIVNKRRSFDPSTDPPGYRVDNRMVYVVAFEEDGYARDVTPRYAVEYGAKVSKMQQGGKGKQDWWERVMAMVRRPYRLNRDDLEDDELHVKQLTEQMPTTMTGFKNHPLYVLARHLRRDEVIHPLVELGKFRGEPVYPRSSVVTLKTAENWMRQGRKVREGCQPMKWVKQHAVTVNKKRAIEMAMAERGDGLAVAGEESGQGFAGEKDVMQPMYAQGQTELYTPPPVVDGVVPKNDFGNIDLYVPSMLPAGAAYVPYKGAAKIARQLGFDHAEAVTGFEFKKRRAFPVISGVVVAAENEEALLEAYWAAEREAQEKRRTKQKEQVIKRWQRLVQGLRIRQRLQEQYVGKKTRQTTEKLEVEERVAQVPGGFLNTADNVVQPYSLPRNLHEVPSSPAPPQSNDSVAHRASLERLRDHTGLEGHAPPRLFAIETFDIEDSQEAEGSGENGTLDSTSEAKTYTEPKTMRELFEATGQSEGQQTDDVANEVTIIKPSLPTIQGSGIAAKAASNGNGTVSKRSPRSRTGTSQAMDGRSGVGTRTPAHSSKRRGRKRNREETITGSESDEGEAGVVGSSPVKRSRASKAPEPVPRSDRVLRTRRSKTAAQLQEEKEQEEAYRRAIT